MDTIDQLRAATEDEVREALDGAYVSLPIENAADLLEAYKRILDLKLGLPEE